MKTPEQWMDEYDPARADSTGPTELTVERIKEIQDDAAADQKSWADELAKDICEMEDALGFKNDCTDKDGAFVPTKGPWKERVRDLIAKEGELGDLRTALTEIYEAISKQASKPIPSCIELRLIAAKIRSL